MLESVDDFTALVKMLENRAEILRGEKRWAALARIAEVFEDQFNDLAGGDPPLRSGARRRRAEPGGAQGARSHLQPDRSIPRSARHARAADPRSGHATPAHRALRAARRHLRRRVPRPREGRRSMRSHSRPRPQRRTRPLGRRLLATTALSTAGRTWRRPTSGTSNDHARRQAQGRDLLALGRVLLEQMGSPGRAAPRPTSRCSRSIPTTAVALEALAKLRAGSRRLDARAPGHRDARRASARRPKPRPSSGCARPSSSKSRATSTAPSSATRWRSTRMPHAAAAEALRAAYTARGDAAAAVELIEPARSSSPRAPCRRRASRRNGAALQAEAEGR